MSNNIETKKYKNEKINKRKKAKRKYNKKNISK